MKPRTTSYKVKRGDSLWSISTYVYGDPKYWPEIAEANHLAKADLILVGQLLKIADLSSHAKSPTHVATGHNRHPTVTPVLYPNVNPKRLARPLRYPAYKYDLEKVFPAVTVVIPPFEYKIRLKGEITLQSHNTIPNVALTKDGIETKYLDLKNTEMVLKCKAETDKELEKFFSEPKIKFDPRKKTLELSYAFGTATKLSGGAFATSKVTLLLNGFKYTFEVTDVKGDFDAFSFDGTLGYEIEVTQAGVPPALKIPDAPPVGDAPSVNWNEIAWKAAAVGLVLGTIVEDIISLGGGAFDDPVSFAAAAAMWSRAAVAY
jgi:hypothetical protein